MMNNDPASAERARMIAALLSRDAMIAVKGAVNKATGAHFDEDDNANIARAVLRAAADILAALPPEPQEAPHLFVKGEFTAHSGDVLPFKIDCDALTDADLDTLAAEIAKDFKFSSVVGVPRGGVRLHTALTPYLEHGHGTLIVDDVLTTGRSMEEVRQRFDPTAKGVVIFARGPCPDWITPLCSWRPAAAPEPQEASGWRPIDTALKIDDRSKKLLLWWPHWNIERPVAGYWTEWGWRADEALAADGIKPTHWRPYPAAAEPAFPGLPPLAARELPPAEIEFLKKSTLETLRSAEPAMRFATEEELQAQRAEKETDRDEAKDRARYAAKPSTGPSAWREAADRVISLARGYIEAVHYTEEAAIVGGLYAEMCQAIVALDALPAPPAAATPAEPPYSRDASAGLDCRILLQQHWQTARHAALTEARGRNDSMIREAGR